MTEKNLVVILSCKLIRISYFQVLVALACDLGLDSLFMCLEIHKWTWFRRYCMAARVAKALQNRTPLPPTFCEQVMKKIQEISGDGETISRVHEDHDFFRREQDEQLLLWLNRYVAHCSAAWYFLVHSEHKIITERSHSYSLFFGTAISHLFVSRRECTGKYSAEFALIKDG